MSMLENIRLALSSLRSNKMRSLLTLLGVIIGIASVITILTLGSSLTTQMVDSVSDAGLNDYNASIQQKPDAMMDENGAPPPGGDAMMMGMGGPFEGTLTDVDKISPDLIEQMKQQFPKQIAGVSIGPIGYGFGGSTSPDDDPQLMAYPNITPVNADYMWMTSVKVAAGRSLNEQDVEGARPVAVITEDLANELWPGMKENVLGRTFSWTTDQNQSMPFMVIGISPKNKPSGLLGKAMGDFKDFTMWIPYTAMDRVGMGTSTFDSIMIRPANGYDNEEFQNRLNQFFDNAYSSNDTWTVHVSDQKDTFSSIKKVMDGLSAGLAAIGGISLLVGGIGVMNIMLVTVTERTREIGIRKALGARNSDIRMQFVIESIIICLFGGLLGVLIGGSVGMIGAKLLGKIVLPPLWGVFVSLVFSMGIGLFFGYYPANKAAKLNPIDALRYE